VRSNLRSNNVSDSTGYDVDEQQRDTGFAVHALGTGAGSPSSYRSNPCSAVRVSDGSVFVVDAGEGTQMQLMKSKLHVDNVRKIFGKIVEPTRRAYIIDEHLLVCRFVRLPSNPLFDLLLLHLSFVLLVFLRTLPSNAPARGPHFRLTWLFVAAANRRQGNDFRRR